MPFHLITYNEKYHFATLHNYGCTFRCNVCSYRLRSGPEGTPGLSYPKPERFLSIHEIKNALASVEAEKVFFMGGEPTLSKDLPDILDFIKNKMKVKTYLGHTNGSNLPMKNLDGANVGLKAWDEKVHLRYTGREKAPIFSNFESAVRANMDMKANMVFIPGFVDIDQIESVASWLADMDPNIPFHIMGYIPIPGQPFQRPNAEQMNEVLRKCKVHLRNVAMSHLSADDALDLTKRDDRFMVRIIS